MGPHGPMTFAYAIENIEATCAWLLVSSLQDYAMISTAVWVILLARFAKTPALLRCTDRRVVFGSFSILTQRLSWCGSANQNLRMASERPVPITLLAADVSIFWLDYTDICSDMLRLYKTMIRRTHVIPQAERSYIKFIKNIQKPKAQFCWD